MACQKSQGSISLAFILKDGVALNMDMQEAIRLHKRADEYRQKGNMEGAISSLREIADKYRLYEGIHVVYAQLGGLLADKGELDEALSLLTESIRLDSNYREAYYDLGVYFAKKEMFDKAIENYNKSIEIDPNYFDAYSSIAKTYIRMKQFKKAKTYLNKALELNPFSYEANVNMANVLGAIGEINGIAKYCDTSKVQSNDKHYINSNVLLALNYSEHYSDEEIYKCHFDYNESYAKEYQNGISSFSNDADPNRKIRIGYLSPDFRSHSVAYFLLPVLYHHNKEQFEIYAYANVKNEDVATEQVKQFVNVWRDIKDKSDDEAAEMIRKDKIDILIDLAGHTGNNRLLIFARKPAPIQVTWLGYPNTTGLKTIDYRITDEYADPTGQNDQYYTEKLVRLPKTFLCYSLADTVPEVVEPQKNSDKGITFASFNNFSKITDEMIALWSKILCKVIDSELILKAEVFKDNEVVDEIISKFKTNGVDTERIILLSRDDKVEDHWNRYNSVDIALDTYPYNGTTTTCEAMIMGVPVVTLAGKRHASRVGVSLLENVGVSELIAYSPEEYVNKAVELAHDRGKIALYKKSLRNMMKQSPLMRQKVFVFGIERLYRNMWIVWCKEEMKKGILDSLGKDGIMDITEAEGTIKKIISQAQGIASDFQNGKNDCAFKNLDSMISSIIWVQSKIKKLLNYYPQSLTLIEGINKGLNLVIDSIRKNDTNTAIDCIKNVIITGLNTVLKIIGGLVDTPKEAVEHINVGEGAEFMTDKNKSEIMGQLMSLGDTVHEAIKYLLSELKKGKISDSAGVLQSMTEGVTSMHADLLKVLNTSEIDLKPAISDLNKSIDTLFEAYRQENADQAIRTIELTLAPSFDQLYKLVKNEYLRCINNDAENTFAFSSNTDKANVQKLVNTKLTEDEFKRISEKVRSYPYWYHKIELPGGLVTPGWAPLNRDSYRIPSDMSGMRVLDVGAWDGFWTFEALKRGAKQVVAIDDFSDFLGSLKESDRRAWETFDMCKEALGYSDVECQRYEMSVYDISEEKLGRFDVVFFFGTLYHLRHPLLALDKLSAVCDKEIYVETALLDDYSPFQGGLGKGYPGAQVVAEFYSENQYGNNNTNWWVPNLNCLVHMVYASGFKKVDGWKLVESPTQLCECRGFARGVKDN